MEKPFPGLHQQQEPQSGASSERRQAKDPQKPSFLSPVVSISSTGETEGTIAEKLLFASFPSPMILIFPCGKTEGSDIRNEEEKLFFLQKVFLFATSHREIANSLFKNAPYG